MVGNVCIRGPQLALIIGPIKTLKLLQRRRHSLKLWNWLLGGILMVGAGCTRVPRSPANQTSAPLIWPAPPETARITYVQSVVRPADLGLRPSALTRFGHWLTGSQKGNEPLQKPFGLALDEDDNLCLTDTGANAVCYYDQAKRKWHRWEKIGQLQFASPVAVAKRNGVIFVADSTLASVVAFNLDGKLQFQLTNHLARPSGLVIINGQLFVADSQRHAIVVFDLHGTLLREFGHRGTGPAQFNFPTHLAADGAGQLYVTDSMNNRIQILDADGHFKKEFGQLGDRPGQFGRPKGLAVDAAGRLYAIDALFDNVQIFDPAGQLLLTLGGAGAQPGQFWLPNGIVISRQNQIFVADSYNHRVQIFKYIGPS